MGGRKRLITSDSIRRKLNADLPILGQATLLIPACLRAALELALRTLNPGLT